MRIAGVPSSVAEPRAVDLLARVGLSARRTHRPTALSGGEQQRCAVARALAMQPTVLLADEPSGNLDHQNAESLHAVFAQLSRDLGLAIVVATHNRSLAERADRVLVLADGRLTPGLSAAGMV
jgi:lipoprotein-releasing system ATP-binding protein